MLPFDPGDLSYTPLSDGCQREAFSCGAEVVDRWFHERAHTYHDKHHCRVTTIHAPGEEVPVAFYALGVVAERLTDKKTLIPNFLLGGTGHFPSLRLEWAAVRHDLQGKKLGEIVMGRVLTVFEEIVAETGMPALTLSPLNDRAAKFYSKLGFVSFGPPVLGRRMMFPAATIIAAKQAVAAAGG